MRKYILNFVYILIVFFITSTYALDIYVSPNGSDKNNGDANNPLATFGAAQQKARAFAGKESVTIYFADGVYYLPETIVFNPKDSGSKQFPILYRAKNEGKTVLSGGIKLELNWKPFQNGIYQAKTPKGIKIDQVFIDGLNQRMARYPNYDASKKTAPYQGFAADAFSKERAAGWKNPKGGYIHAMHVKEWGGYHYIITGKNKEGEVTYEGGWQNNRQMGMHPEYRMVENIFEELDAAGEWFHNETTQTLYYKPEATADLKKAKVEVVQLEQLINFQGSIKNPIKHISLQGFVIKHAARTFMQTKEPMVRSDWTIFRGGAFMLTGTENIQILDCEFDQVGGNAIFVNNYNRKTLIKGNYIHHTGASGVCFVGDPKALRDPLFEYGQKNDMNTVDKTPGPKTENYPSLGTVEDCLIHNIGTVERQPAGVQIEMAMEITVRDCSIYDCARSGINVGDGAFGGHLIERCDVFNTVLETHDHGSFNSWGRDRFWRLKNADMSKYPELPFADAIKTTVIRNSRWRCDHGWDIDLDDGSTNYDIYNNLMLSGGLKLREGYRRRAWNNITVNNTFHPHVWFENSGDEVFSNIFMFVYQGVKVPTAKNPGKRVDSNLIFNSELTQKFGWDQNSIVADPQFIDPANGDFRVKEGSPAFKIGFKNFPMDQFGVKKPSLKAIARTPIIPVLGVSEELKNKRAAKKGRKPTWLGAAVSGLSGMEFSAYGVAKEDGGIALIKVPKKSKAAKSGLLEGDLILTIKGKKVANLKQFFRLIKKVRTSEIALKVVREQKEIEINISL
ncbi:right-handed parallel beta-helix repeat-containing protein [Polaribacter vadi]|uniref:right-handed parallel beta-helix repeat-containing protein n=1 Tax=Polaribacter TaxID=52959 RepID=UPI001C08B90A|nr:MULTISPECIES: right-handed parallel beta-helix repeat-containing protein [Polaribacter]MBU3011346.1 right-handed parallel beta-helix repeat-containing protein [Polaribacter vadi]MDO6741158.1 right-handed parallel beta-helix repeat-containing protein [Polaribacter sp. 1_MG-2023]